MWHQLKAGSKAHSHVHDGDCEPIASTVSAFAFTECKQSGTPRPPRGKEGHDSPHTHPCDCDGLHPLDSPGSVWTRYLQHRSHLQHYGIALASCAVKDVPTYRERYPIPRLIERGSLKKVIKREGLTWVLRYRVGGREQTPLVVGLVADFPTEDEALLEVDRLGLRVRINCANSGTRRMKFDELAEYYLKVEFDPEVTASPKSENTKPILDHYVRDFLIAEWGDQIAEDIEPLEIQKWFNALHYKKEYRWTTVSKIRGIMNRIFKVGIIHKNVTKNPVEGLATSNQDYVQGDQDHPCSDALDPAFCDGEHAALHSGVCAIRASSALKLYPLGHRAPKMVSSCERKIRIVKSWKKTGVDGDSYFRRSRRAAEYRSARRYFAPTTCALRQKQQA